MSKLSSFIYQMRVISLIGSLIHMSFPPVFANQVTKYQENKSVLNKIEQIEKEFDNATKIKKEEMAKDYSQVISVLVSSLENPKTSSDDKIKSIELLSKLSVNPAYTTNALSSLLKDSDYPKLQEKAIYALRNELKPQKESLDENFYKNLKEVARSKNTVVTKEAAKMAHEFYQPDLKESQETALSFSAYSHDLFTHRDHEEGSQGWRLDPFKKVEISQELLVTLQKMKEEKGYGSNDYVALEELQKDIIHHYKSFLEDDDDESKRLKAANALSHFESGVSSIDRDLYQKAQKIEKNRVVQEKSIDKSRDREIIDLKMKEANAQVFLLGERLRLMGNMIQDSESFGKLAFDASKQVHELEALAKEIQSSSHNSEYKEDLKKIEELQKHLEKDIVEPLLGISNRLENLKNCLSSGRKGGAALSSQSIMVGNAWVQEVIEGCPVDPTGDLFRFSTIESLTAEMTKISKEYEQSRSHEKKEELEKLKDEIKALEKLGQGSDVPVKSQLRSQKSLMSSKRLYDELLRESMNSIFVEAYQVNLESSKHPMTPERFLEDFDDYNDIFEGERCASYDPIKGPDRSRMIDLLTGQKKQFDNLMKNIGTQNIGHELMVKQFKKTKDLYDNQQDLSKKYYAPLADMRAEYNKNRPKHNFGPPPAPPKKEDFSYQTQNDMEYRQQRSKDVIGENAPDEITEDYMKKVTDYTNKNMTDEERVAWDKYNKEFSAYQEKVHKWNKEVLKPFEEKLENEIIKPHLEKAESKALKEELDQATNAYEQEKDKLDMALAYSPIGRNKRFKDFVEKGMSKTPEQFEYNLTQARFDTKDNAREAFVQLRKDCNDLDQEEFIKNMLKTNPMVVSRVLAREPHAEALFCQYMREIPRDERDRTIRQIGSGVLAVLASTALIIGTGGIGATGIPAVILVLGTGAIATSQVGMALHDYNKVKSEREAANKYASLYGQIDPELSKWLASREKAEFQNVFLEALFFIPDGAMATKYLLRASKGSKGLKAHEAADLLEQMGKVTKKEDLFPLMEKARKMRTEDHIKEAGLSSKVGDETTLNLHSSQKKAKVGESYVFSTKDEAKRGLLLGEQGDHLYLKFDGDLKIAKLPKSQISKIHSQPLAGQIVSESQKGVDLINYLKKVSDDPDNFQKLSKEFLDKQKLSYTKLGDDLRINPGVNLNGFNNELGDFALFLKENDIELFLSAPSKSQKQLNQLVRVSDSLVDGKKVYRLHISPEIMGKKKLFKKMFDWIKDACGLR